MLLAEKMLGNPIYDIATGNRVGAVKDIYLDGDLRRVSGLYVGSDGMFSRTPRFIPRGNIQVIGEDSVLATAEPETGPVPEDWTRRDALNGRDINTGGGTRIGTVGDVILDTHARVAGFTLDRLFVSGPLAERGAFGRTAVVETGSSADSMIVDLARAEQQNVAVESHLFKTDEVTTADAAANDDTLTPYAQKDLQPLIHLRNTHGMKSPYVTSEGTPAPDPQAATPYTSRKPDTDAVDHAAESEAYKSPYVTGDAQPA